MQGMLSVGETIEPSGVQRDRSEIRFGEQFQGYTIEREIGRGGMGVIYRARHQQVNRVVALKRVSFLGAEAADVRARFRSEVEAVAALDHSHIVPIYEVGECDGEPFFTMKFLAGGTLADRLAQLIPGSAGTSSGSGSTTRRRGATAAAMMIKIARAVHFAHQHGVLHRDLKPSNILLDTAGEPYVADFGLAKRLGQDSSVTISGQALGTPAYMSPEQARGRNRDLSVATDIFSLGAIFYHLLSGKRPFDGESAVEVMKAVMDDDPVPPGKVNRHVEADLATICLKCLEKQPDLRYQSAEEFAADLESWQNREPIRARPATSVERVAKWVRRKPAVAGFVFTSLLLVLVMGIGGPLVAWQQARSKQAAEDAGQLAQDRSDQLEQTLYEAEMVLAGTELLLADGHQLAKHLTERWIPAPGKRDLRGWEWQFLRNEAESDLKTVYQSQISLHAGDWSRDGRLLATGDMAGKVVVIDVETGAEVASYQLANQLMAIAFNHDATRLAAGNRSGESWVIDLKAGKVMWNEQIARTWVFDCAWSPDGKQVVFSGGMKDLVILNGEDGGQVAVLKGHGHDVRSVRWTEQHGIVSASRDGSVRFWDPLTHRETRRVRPSIQTRVLTLSPDGRQLAVGGHDGKIAIVEVASGKTVRAFEAHRLEVVNLDWDENSGLLLSGSWDQTAKIWNPESGRLQLTIRGHGNRVEAAYWDPTGTRILTVSRDGSAKLWDAARRQKFMLKKFGNGARLRWNAQGTRLAIGIIGTPDLLLFDPATWSIRHKVSISDNLRFIDWHHERDEIAVLNWAGRITIHDAEGKVLREFKPGDHEWRDLSWSPDGRQLALLAETGQMRLLDSDTGEPIWKQEQARQSIHSVHWFPAGDRLLFGGQKVRIVNAADGTDDRVFDLHGQLSLTLREFDGEMCFASAASQEDIIRVWSEDQPVSKWQGHSMDIAKVQWHPRDARLASAGLDGTVRIWNADTGTPTLVLRDHTDKVESLAWSADGRYLATVDDSGMLLIRDGGKASNRK